MQYYFLERVSVKIVDCQSNMISGIVHMAMVCYWYVYVKHQK